MVPAPRQTPGIQLAPPAVGAIAYLSVSSGEPDMVAHALVRCPSSRVLVLIRMLPWIMEQPFTPTCQGFTFGATALDAEPSRMVDAGAAETMAGLASYLFMAANMAVGSIGLGTLSLGASVDESASRCGPDPKPRPPDQRRSSDRTA